MSKVFLFCYRFFISLRLAVLTLGILAFLTALGTFIESKYDQETANKIIYHSWLMGFALSLLATNLTFVLIDRWPWKKRQVGFVLAHIGILMVILGSVMTKYLGVDASLRFSEGKSSSQVRLSDREIRIYSSYDGSKFTLLYQQAVDFFFDRPSKDSPFSIPIANETFHINQYFPYGIPRENYRESSAGGEPALRFYLKGKMGQFVDWIQLDKNTKTKTIPVGPAFMTLTKDKNYKPQKKKELILFVHKNKLFYVQSPSYKKEIKVGGVFQTQWMDFEFRLVEFFSKSQKEFLFTSNSVPTKSTLQAIQVTYNGLSSWVGENAYVRFYAKDRVYAFGYLNKSKDLGFDLKLLDFRMTKYQGSDKAKTYESEVEVEGKKFIISMNEPLKYKGYTFYQSSFEESEQGEANVSILSVNRDPGRILKYLGASLVVLGILLLFLKRKFFGMRKKS